MKARVGATANRIASTSDEQIAAQPGSYATTSICDGDEFGSEKLLINHYSYELECGNPPAISPMENPGNNGRSQRDHYCCSDGVETFPSRYRTDGVNQGSGCKRGQMSQFPETMIAVRDELERIEEDCIHSGKAQFNAGVRWSRYHLWLGVPAVILSALAGTAFFKGEPEIAGVMSMVVAILTALSTFLKPAEHAASHKSSGDQYLALRNDARVLRTIKIAAACDDLAAIANLDEITKRRNELNQASPQASRSDFEKARQGIEEGEASHRIDQSKA